MGSLRELRRLLSLYQVRPTKRLGQRFCVDENLLKRMVEWADLGKEDVVLEIGPGFGFLTRLLSEKAGRVIAVELADKLAQALRESFKAQRNVEVIRGDILAIPLPPFNKVVANPPYSISSKLMFRVLDARFDLGIMTFQREFAQRLAAKPGTPDFGRLTVMADYRSTIEILEHVPRSSFYPVPKVESAVVRVRPRREIPYKVLNEAFFFNLVRALFSQRNKKVQNSLIPFLVERAKLSKEDARILIKDLPNLNARPYTLSPVDLAELSNKVYSRVFQGRKITLDCCRFYVFPEVYTPSDDTELLSESMCLKGGERVLDMGTGCGILAVLAAVRRANVVAVDVNPLAADCARKNAEINGVSERIEIREGDLFDIVGPDERFDLILFNPPYLPLEEEQTEGWLNKAWSGGLGGRKTIDRFLDGLPDHLSRGGKLLMVQSTLSDVEETLTKLRRLRLRARTIAERKLDFETIKVILAESAT